MHLHVCKLTLMQHVSTTWLATNTDLHDAREQKQVAERKAQREKYGNLVFRPSSTPKSMRTVSVTNHARNQEGGHQAAVNARIFRSRRAGGGG